MAKLNVNKAKTIKQAMKTHKSATTNRAGGLAFKFENAAEYLIATIGSATFVEPKFYKDVANPADLKTREFNTDGLDEQAVKIINACFEIAESDNPRDLVALAHWARTDMRMRTTPQVMLAIAANHPKTKPFVRRYVPMVSRRADDVFQVVGAYEHIFGWKGFPACLKKGISDRMSKMSEYEILKYNHNGHPNFKDLLRFCERRKGYPFSEEIRTFILKGEVTNPDAIPMIAARKALTARKEWSDEIPYLAKAAGSTWEVLVSQFGNKAEVWEAIIPTMGYMALLRNIGNFLTADISIESANFVANKLSNPEAILKSKQLPFRFLAAYRVLYPDTSTWHYGLRPAINRDRDAWDKRKLQIFLNAVEAALDISVENAVLLPGVTCIAADNSGSMSSAISEKSVMTIRDAGNALCSIVHRRSEESHVAAFGNASVWPPITKRNSILTNMNAIASFRSDYRGHATNAWTVFRYLLDNKIKVDRVIILSDMQCYDTYRGRGNSVAEFITTYRRQINPNAYAHFFDLKGYGSRQTPSGDPLTNVVAGFSEKILDQILVFEGAKSADGKELPSLEYIRKNF